MTIRIVNAVAPTRICDVGGWTDTHFARYGSVFNIAIYPYVEVQVAASPRRGDEERLTISAENYGVSWSPDPESAEFGKHPLLEAAVRVMELPAETALRINIFSYAPPGASMGTSAAVSVALVGALDALTRGCLAPHQVAQLAHSIETKELGLECGVQDQLASAYGGINFIDITDFPHSSISGLSVPDSLWWDLEQRLLLAYIGKPHDSSEIHRMVIGDLGANPHEDARLAALRALAVRAKNALCERDIAELGRVFDENTGVQRALHPGLVCEDFENVIAIARDFGAAGCKVNGAGGDGGSIAILTNGNMAEKRRLQRALEDSGYLTLPVYLSRRGLRVWESRG